LIQQGEETNKKTLVNQEDKKGLTVQPKIALWPMLQLHMMTIYASLKQSGCSGCAV